MDTATTSYVSIGAVQDSTPVADAGRSKRPWILGGAAVLVAVAIAAFGGSRGGGEQATASQRPSTSAVGGVAPSSSRTTATAPESATTSPVTSALDPAKIAYIVGAIDELATIDGDGIITWVIREGGWIADNQDLALVSAGPTQEYIEEMLAALQKVGDGEVDFTDQVTAILALRDEIAALAPGAVETTPPTPAAPAPAEFKDIELTGRGSKVVRFKVPEDEAAIARISHRGTSNFIVETLDENGDTNELLVNEIGRYTGNHLFDDASHSVAFKIDADGQWRILVRPVTKARAWDASTTLTGKGSDVVRLTRISDGLTTLTIRHRGSSNFAVYAYSFVGRELLVNEIGNYSGEVLLPDGTVFLTVEADGDWSGVAG